ncbi:serine hydrolase domain-containing protein [Agromyces aureus]|nr:serine hydrolase domain-containing protein [Agromyces aureus]
MQNSRRTVAAIAAAAVTVGTALALGGCAATTASDAATSPPATSAPLLDTALRTQLETALDEGFAASGMPGVIVGVWVPGEDEWVSARGVADVETEEPMSRENQQKIGSITKTIVGTVMLQVIGEGEFDVGLDDTLDRWYPDFPEASNITVRMLLNHSSGVGEAGRAQVDRICADPHAIPAPDQLIAISAATPRADFAPGDGFEYANGNYFLLGGILEQVTGADLATLIHDRITEPFGMDRSRFAPDGEVTAPLTHGYSGFCPDLGETVDTVEWSNGESWAGGAMVSTLDDLHAWGEALGQGAGVTPDLQVARYADRAIISEETGSAYGLGAGVVYDTATDCVLIVSHAGAEPGYGTNFAYYPMTGAVLAMLGNGDGGTGDAASEITKALAPLLGPVLYPTPTEACAAPWG